MKFDYLQRIVVEGQLDVENIGDCVIVANNDLGREYYLVIKTLLGWTEILDYGPYTPDFIMLHNEYSVKYSRIEYNETKIEKVIERFLNDPKRMITQAKISTLEEVREFLVNPIDKLYYYEGG